MRSLSEIRDDGRGNPTLEGETPYTLSVTNIDDVLWFFRAKGITELLVTPSEAKIAMWYYVCNTTNDDSYKAKFLREGSIDRLLGVNLHLHD